MCGEVEYWCEGGASQSTTRPQLWTTILHTFFFLPLSFSLSNFSSLSLSLTQQPNSEEEKGRNNGCRWKKMTKTGLCIFHGHSLCLLCISTIATEDLEQNHNFCLPKKTQQVCFAFCHQQQHRLLQCLCFWGTFIHFLPFSSISFLLCNFYCSFIQALQHLICIWLFIVRDL